MTTNSCHRCLGVALLTISAVLFQTPCVGNDDEGADASSEDTARGVVVVIRGLAGYWPGCDTFCQRVRAYGEDVIAYKPENVQRHTTQIVAGIQSGRWSYLRVVGYSKGADGAIELVRTFQRYGISVERLILIEATTPNSIPGNVGYCFNIYSSRPVTDWLPVLRGVRVRRESTDTQLINYDVRKNGSRLSRLNHLNFPSNAQLQTLVAHHAGAPSQAPVEEVAEAEPVQHESSTERR